ncbi:IS66 family transposase [Marinobacter psychrophilus]|uniref:IS66 family transposase n=1 Tax=Marinobacter psychrophilus TaxID=330734 RepID=UPI003B59C1CF
MRGLNTLNTLKTWLESNAGRFAKGILTFTAMDYTLNQWPTSVGYCARGDLQISNALSEKAIHPFSWLKSMAICRYLAGRPYQCNVLLPDGSCESRQLGILGLYSACFGAHC